MNGVKMRKLNDLLKRVAGRLKLGGQNSGRLERGVRGPLEESGLAFSASEWVSLLVLASLSVFIASFALFFFLFSAFQALGLALASSASVGLGVYAYPFLQASRNARAMEGELPLFIARLLSLYAEGRDMAASLKATIYFFEGRLAEKARASFALYLAGGNAREAFRTIMDNAGSHHARRAFALIAEALDSGVDVGDALADVARDASSSIEFEAEKESRTGLASWVISASSAFFFPLFAALGLVMMNILEKIALLSPYTNGEHGFIELTVFFYLFAGVVLDAGYNGRVRFGDFLKGVLLFTAPLALTAVLVFALAFKLANSMAGS